MSTSGDYAIQRIQHKLKEANGALQKSTQYGLHLLDGQLDLQNKLDEQWIEMTNTVEVILHTRKQLDQVLQQAQDPNSKGNSLFGELEDKPAAIERQLIRMKVQHQSLQKQHAFSKQHLHRMKVPIATLMQLQGSRADPAQLERLQSMLSEKNSELQALMIKLCLLEKVEITLEAQPSAAPVETDSGDGTYCTDLKMQLSNNVKDAQRLGDELSMQTTVKSLSESQRPLELERKLFSAVRALKQSQSDNIKLQVKVEEFRLKYEPDVVNKNLIQKRKCEKLPADMPSDLPEVKKEEPMVLEVELPKEIKQERPQQPQT